jgi:hypothetical protein
MIQPNKKKKKQDVVYNDHLIDDVEGLEMSGEMLYSKMHQLEAENEIKKNVNNKLTAIIKKTLLNMNYVLEEIERDHPGVAQAKLLESIEEVHNDCTGIINFTE